MPVSSDDVLTHVINVIKQGQQPQPSVLRQMLDDYSLRRRLLEQPAIADALAQAATLRSQVGCAEVGEEIPVLIDAERRGTALARLVQIKQHIELCPWCMDLYAATRALAEAQANGQAPQWPKPPVRPPLTIPPSILPLVVSQKNIQHALRQARTLRGRHATGVNNRPLVYSGPVPGHPELFIDLQLRDMPKDDVTQTVLFVRIHGAASVANRTVTLQRGSEILSVRTNSAGETFIADVPSGWLQPDAGDLLIFIGSA